MRSFSSFEREIIKRMIELDENPQSLNVLSNILNSFYEGSELPSYCYISVLSETDVSINIKPDSIDPENPDFLHNVDHKITNILFVTVNLFEFLTESKLAYFMGEVNVKSIGTVQAGVTYSECDFFEDEIKSLIYKYARKKIRITEDLKTLVRDDFKSKERIWKEKEEKSRATQLTITQVALVITTLSLLASIFNPLESTTKVEVLNSGASEVVVALKDLENIALRIQSSIDNNNLLRTENIDQQLIDINIEISEIHQDLLNIESAHNK